MASGNRGASALKRASAPRRASIAVVDAHPLIREGLAVRISAEPDLQVCCEACDSAEALTLIRRGRPDLVILDLAFQCGSGLALIKKLRADGGGPKILVISAYEEDLLAERALRAGAQGYLSQQELQGSVIEAIRVVLRGQLFVSANLAQRLASQAISGRSVPHGIGALSDREMQIFELIGQGLGTRAIAGSLNLSVHTIESHRENIRMKLNLRSGTELMRQAVLWTFEGRN